MFIFSCFKVLSVSCCHPKPPYPSPLKDMPKDVKLIKFWKYFAILLLLRIYGKSDFMKDFKFWTKSKKKSRLRNNLQELHLIICSWYHRPFSTHQPYQKYTKIIFARKRWKIFLFWIWGFLKKVGSAHFLQILANYSAKSSVGTRHGFLSKYLCRQRETSSLV